MKNKIKPLIIKQNKNNHMFFKTFTFMLSLFFIFGIGLLLNLVQFSFETELDFSKFNTKAEVKNVTVLDDDGNTIFKAEDENFVYVKDLSEHTKNAFIAIEDKRFYSHNGIDLRRMVGATMQNLKDGKFSEGASTITQQLIKNVALNNEKTLKRKATEIKLALDLEKVWNKEQILEAYLNNIYFGNNQVGLFKASKFYFNKKPTNLSLKESAFLAGIINAPAIFNPLKNFEKTENRANLILDLMFNQKLISLMELNEAKNQTVNIIPNVLNNNNSYEFEAIKEASSILEMNEAEFLQKGYTIVTYLNEDIQSKVQSQIGSGLFSPENENSIFPDSLMLVADNNLKAVVAYMGNSNQNLSELKRQPGSTIKPILVYAPAIENGYITSESLILDEEININGYSPSNFNNQYYGWVTANFALQKSLNAPAIKLMNYVGIENCKKFANKLGISFNENDDGFALALGGFTDGVSLLDLSSAYSALATDGNYEKLSFVKEIYDANNRLIYSRKHFPVSAIKKETAKTLTTMLKQTAKTGTAKRLSNLNIASKTGTVASSINPEKNTDAYNISYNEKYTYAVWQGNTSGEKGLLSKEVNGGTYPTIIVQNVAK